MMEGEETGRGNQEGKEENTINKISQTQKDKYCLFPLAGGP